MSGIWLIWRVRARVHALNLGPDLVLLGVGERLRAQYSLSRGFGGGVEGPVTSIAGGGASGGFLGRGNSGAWSGPVAFLKPRR